MKKVYAFLRITRPANVISAIADVLAGVTIAGRFENGLYKNLLNILLLCAATMFLYAGGIVYNDVFDADFDAVVHPDRPIPSGVVKLSQAKPFGFILLLIGIALAGLGSNSGGFIAVGITFFALIYNRWGKNNAILGPLNPGICRGLNLMLGLSIVPFELQHWYLLGLVPVIYIYGVMLISRGEVYGGNKQNLNIGALLYAAVIGTILYQANINGELNMAVLFLIPFGLMIFIPLSGAMQHPSGANVDKAVKSGMLALILMDAAWAVTFESWIAGNHNNRTCLVHIVYVAGKSFCCPLISLQNHFIAITRIPAPKMIPAGTQYFAPRYLF